MDGYQVARDIVDNYVVGQEQKYAYNYIDKMEKEANKGQYQRYVEVQEEQTGQGWSEPPEVYDA